MYKFNLTPGHFQFSMLCLIPYNLFTLSACTYIPPCLENTHRKESLFTTVVTWKFSVILISSVIVFNDCISEIQQKYYLLVGSNR